ncbi:hypothetical protein WG66_016571 [Moniliophthora roreri]|nr:hypothetical protein WG66_016571 [Moniliophthora roreri]
MLTARLKGTLGGRLGDNRDGYELGGSFEEALFKVLENLMSWTTSNGPVNNPRYESAIANELNICAGSERQARIGNILNNITGFISDYRNRDSKPPELACARGSIRHLLSTNHTTTDIFPDWLDSRVPAHTGRQANQERGHSGYPSYFRNQEAAQSSTDKFRQALGGREVLELGIVCRSQRTSSFELQRATQDPPAYHAQPCLGYMCIKIVAILSQHLFPH